MSTKPNNAITKGVHHVGLTVPNLDTTRKFFIDVLNFEQVGEVESYPAVFLHDGVTMITLWQVVDPASAKPFDRKKVIGLHHLALSVENHEGLANLHTTLETTDSVTIEFAPEPLGDGPAEHMICSIPGGIRLEFISLND